MVDVYGIEIKEGSWVLWAKQGLRLRVKNIQKGAMQPKMNLETGQLEQKRAPTILTFTFDMELMPPPTPELAEALPDFVVLMNPSAPARDDR